MATRVSSYTFAIAGVACMLAAAPARAAMVLAVSTISSAMRTEDLSEMGDAWGRMRASSVTLAASGLVLALSALGALAFAMTTRSYLGVALGEAVVLVAVGAVRLFMGTSTGALRRRRTFEPDRVREAPSGALGWPYLLVVAGAAFLIASLIKGWLDFIDIHKHNAPAATTFLLWLAVALVGIAAAGVAFARNKDGALRASSFAGSWLDARASTTAALTERFLVGPATDLTRRIDVWLPGGEGALGRFVDASGRLATAGSRAPALPVVIVLAVVLALAVALFAPGVLR